MVNIIEYKPKHLKILKDLHLSQKYKGVKHIKNATLPKIGYIIAVFGQPAAAGFLRMVEGGFAQIDTMVTAAYLPSDARHQALNVLVETLTDKAKALKLKGIYAHTQSPDVLLRAEALGWKQSPQCLIILPL